MSRLHSKWAKAGGAPRAAGSRFVLGVVSSCALVVAFFVLPAAVVSASEVCQGNEGRRVEQGSTFLPDCRAFELVTPPNKDSGEPIAVIPGLRAYKLRGVRGAQASLSGERMAWISEYNLPVSSSIGLNYLSTRGVGGWSSEDVVPPQSVENGTACPFIVGMAAYSSDLSKSVLADGFGQPKSSNLTEGISCGQDEPELVAGEPKIFQNLFVRNNNTSSYSLVNVTPSNTPPPAPNAGEQYFPAAFLAGSSSLDHVVFEEELGITPEAPGGDDLYEWSSDGTVKLVSVLPDGTKVLGRLAGSTRNAEIEQEAGNKVVPFNIANYRFAVSKDGKRVFFNAEGRLYVRENADREQSALDGGDHCIEPEKACTVQVDASQVSGHSGGGGGEFMIASENGGKVFFTDEASAGLTSDTVEGSGQNLYEYDVESGTLTDLTPVGDAGVDGVSGASDDGSLLYFVAEGALALNTTAGHGAIAGQPNLYVDHDGVLTFIATLDPSSDSCDWMSRECIDFPYLGGLSARVSGNGAFIGFDSDSNLTGYDNKGSACVPQLLSGEAENVATFAPGACEEIFLYDVTTNELSCASCDQSGATPAGPAVIRFPATHISEEMKDVYPERNVSESGQVFFETATPLVPAATNGKLNVYEYENGQQYLLSGGTGEADSYFLDASADGSNVFFATPQRLLVRDSDSAYDIYDARVGGGFPEPTRPSPACEGEGCGATVVGAPVFATPSSVTFNGPGNITTPPVPTQPVVKAKAKPVKCKKGHVKKKGKCVKQTKVRVKQPAKGRK